MQSVEISFKGSEDNGTLFASIRNPAVLSAGLHDQIKRYGLTGPSGHKPYMSGTMNGTRRALTDLIHTYGFNLEVVPFDETTHELTRG